MACTERTLCQVLFVGDSTDRKELVERVKERGLTPQRAYCVDEAIEESLKTRPRLIIVSECLPVTREDLETLRMAELAAKQPGDGDKIRKAKEAARTGGIAFLENWRAREGEQQHIPVLFLTEKPDGRERFFEEVLRVGGDLTDWMVEDEPIGLVLGRCRTLFRRAGRQ